MSFDAFLLLSFYFLGNYERASRRLNSGQNVDGGKLVCGDTDWKLARKYRDLGFRGDFGEDDLRTCCYPAFLDVIIVPTTNASFQLFPCFIPNGSVRTLLVTYISLIRWFLLQLGPTLPVAVLSGLRPIGKST